MAFFGFRVRLKVFCGFFVFFGLFGILRFLGVFGLIGLRRTRGLFKSSAKGIFKTSRIFSVLNGLFVKALRELEGLIF